VSSYKKAFKFVPTFKSFLLKASFQKLSKIPSTKAVIPQIPPHSSSTHFAFAFFNATNFEQRISNVDWQETFFLSPVRSTNFDLCGTKKKERKAISRN
jgi:hypothetical protein